MMLFKKHNVIYILVTLASSSLSLSSSLTLSSSLSLPLLSNKTRTTHAFLMNHSSSIQIKAKSWRRVSITKSTNGDENEHGHGHEKNNINNSNNSNNIANEYLDQASKLRREAEELEMIMTTTRKNSSSTDTSGVGVGVNDETVNNLKKKIYTQLGDSTWTISYRFASDPVTVDDGANANANANADANANAETKPMIFYSGKVVVCLKEDGFTTLVSPSSSSPSPSPSPLSFSKFWGWDEDISTEDENTYLSFSADVILPTSDPNYNGDGGPCRFYFNSQVEKDGTTGEISLHSGTVTVKRDVESPGGGGGGFWGIFNAGGILAQFRYCGEFLMKPL